MHEKGKITKVGLAYSFLPFLNNLIACDKGLRSPIKPVRGGVVQASIKRVKQDLRRKEFVLLLFSCSLPC